MRQAGVAARLIGGDISPKALGAAECVVLTGKASLQSLDVAKRASQAGVPVILDIGSVDILVGSIAGGQDTQFIELASLANLITAGNAALAHRVERMLGITSVVVVPDPIDSDDWMAASLRYHPGAAVRTVARWIDGLARDVVARARRRWPGYALSGAAYKRIVWFGAARRPNCEGGVAELLLAASDLADLAEEYPLRLDIVGPSPRTARRFLKHLGVPIAFYRYSPRRVRERLRGADLCLLPHGGDLESLAGSPARAALASALGVPVLTSNGASSLLPAMRAALSGRAAERGQQPFDLLPAAREHGDRSVPAAWRHAIDAARAARPPRSAARITVHTERKLEVLLLLQQFQDIDLIVPVAEAASADPSLDVRIAVLSKIAIPASRRLGAICGNGGKVEFWHGADLLEDRIERTRFAADVAITASEGLGVGARFARAFVVATRAAGARAVTMQHGLDNGGLTFGPKVPPTAFNADLILTWGELHRLSEAACPEIRAKVIPVGCPKRVFDRNDFPGFPCADRPFIAVFENLHWRRYDDAYRRQFVRDLIATAEAAPALTFVIKPHMGGQWFTRLGPTGTPLPRNIEIAEPASQRWRRFTADAFLAHASAVITTPSTIALDAARYGVPVALVTYGISAQNYMPLPRLEQSGDWLAFVEQIRQELYDRKKLEEFYADAAVAGDAVNRILTVIKMAGARHSHAEILAALDAPPLGLAAS
ncbi:MAG: hypothetical protein R3D05_04590 [Dongiaceae bacterium]